jgi:hypothetical protein
LEERGKRDLMVGSSVDGSGGGTREEEEAAHSTYLRDIDDDVVRETVYEEMMEMVLIMLDVGIDADRTHAFVHWVFAAYGMTEERAPLLVEITGQIPLVGGGGSSTATTTTEGVGMGGSNMAVGNASLLLGGAAFTPLASPSATGGQSSREGPVVTSKRLSTVDT